MDRGSSRAFIMLTTIIIIVVVISGVSLYRVLKATSQRESIDAGTAPRGGPLFDVPASVLAAERLAEEESTAQAQRSALLARAAEGDFQALIEAQENGDASFHLEVLNAHINWAADSRERFHALCDFVSSSEALRTNGRLVEAALAYWRQSPGRASTAELLHLAARSDDAAIFRNAAEAVLNSWRGGALTFITAAELLDTIESQYWILGSEARRSGEAFMIKRLLVKLRQDWSAETQRISI